MSERLDAIREDLALAIRILSNVGCSTPVGTSACATRSGEPLSRSWAGSPSRPPRVHAGFRARARVVRAPLSGAAHPRLHLPGATWRARHRPLPCARSRALSRLGRAVVPVCQLGAVIQVRLPLCHRCATAEHHRRAQVRGGITTLTPGEIERTGAIPSEHPRRPGPSVGIPEGARGRAGWRGRQGHGLRPASL